MSRTFGFLSMFRRMQGVIIVFSAGWRKGLFFDFAPLNGELRSYDLWGRLGSYYALLLNETVFRLTEPDWTYLFDHLLFPFISLPKEILGTIVSRARSRDDLGVVMPEVAKYLESKLPVLLERWVKKPVFGFHIDLIRHAANRFLEGDFVSSTAILYPRIEGLLRDLHIHIPTSGKTTQGTLTEHLISATGISRHSYSWLLPEKFKLYLKEVYFAKFEPGEPAKISRHSVGHGVAPVSEFNQKAASIGFLVIDQIFWYLPHEGASALGD